MAIPGKNSDLYRRFRLYGFGFLIGLLIVSFVYKGKGCQLPNSAKMEELGWQKLEYTEHANCRMKCRNITEADIRQVLGKGETKGTGKVNYSKSDVHHKPYPTYAIEGLTSTGKSLRIIIDDVDSISKVVTTIDLRMENDSCDCK
jgi:hypothetical protein